MQSIKRAACVLGISERRLCQLCNDGRVEGAQKIGKTWILKDKIIIMAASRGGGVQKLKMKKKRKKNV